MSRFLFRLLLSSSYLRNLFFSVRLLRFLYRGSRARVYVLHRKGVIAYYSRMVESLLRSAAAGMSCYRFSCYSWSIDNVIAFRLLCYKHPQLSVRLFLTEGVRASSNHMGYAHWQNTDSILVSWDKSGNE